MALTVLRPQTSAEAVGAQAASERWRGVINPPDFPPRARRVIHLCMAGGPSHLESFDYKPELMRLDGQPFPDSYTRGQQLAQLQGAVLKARGPFAQFQRHREA